MQLQVLLLDVDGLMPLYGYGPKEGVSPEQRKKQFLCFKSRNSGLFPKPLTRGKWHKDAIEAHLKAIAEKQQLEDQKLEIEEHKQVTVPVSSNRRKRHNSSTSNKIKLS